MIKTAKVKICTQFHQFESSAPAKLTTMGNVLEVTSSEHKSFGSPCRKVDKDHYVDLRTGEMLEYSHIANRSESKASILHTLSLIRALINTNVRAENSRWVTLTYRENMCDTVRLRTDYEKFWKRFTYWCSRHEIDKPEYITVQEPQGRGAWHVHAFFIWQDKAPFIPNDVICDLWRQGFTKTTAISDCDNIGAYFSAYLGDMPLDEVQALPPAESSDLLEGCSRVLDKDFVDSAGNIKTKKFVKGGRLSLYPPGMNIVRKSSGVLYPSVEYLTLGEIEKKVCSAKQTFSRTYEVLDDCGDVINRISKVYYNTKR